MMQPAPSLLVAAALAAAGPALAPAQSTFILRQGNDTVSVERFTRTATALEAEMVVKAMNGRFRYEVAIGPDSRPTRFAMHFWMASDSAGAPARQDAVLTFEDTTAVVELTGPSGQHATQRVPSRAGALPHLNPSFALWEVALAWARRNARDTVTMFTLSGGQTFRATVTWVGADSAVIDAPGGATRVAVDRENRILGGYLAAQNLTIERSATVGVDALKVEKPDYSAPPGAPYTAGDVTVPTPMGHTLAGTLTLPAGASRAQKVPAVVTITGSGGQDRDEALPPFKGYRPFREFADALAKRGIAVLRMDDRGIGGSGGNPVTATTADFARDIQAGLAYLRSRPEIDPARLALMGHSEGGIIAPMVALDEGALKGLVLLAGTSRTGRAILEFQLPNLIKGNKELSDRQRDSALAAVPAQIDSMAKQPWAKFFLDYDPSATARKVRTPVLILNGATDQQVTPDQVPELVAAFRAAGNRDVTARVLPDLNHLFVRDPDGFPGRYTQLPSFQVDPGVIELVVDWLAKRLLPGVS
jgi:dienelactone hydrolase